jgi:hypothetical protein
MKKTIVLAFILSGFMANAQKISYTTYFNDPTKLSKQKIYLDILSLENIALGAGIHGYYQPIKNITFNGLFRYTYYDFLTKLAEKDSKNPINSPFTGEAGVQLNFANYVKKKERKVGILVEGGMTSKTYIKVPAKKARSFGLRGGVTMYRTPVKSSTDHPFISNGVKMDSSKSFYSNATSTCIYFGYTGRKVRKIGVDADGYGKRRTYLSRVFFADVITGATLLSDVEYNNQTFKIKDTKKNPLGYRLGWEWDENGTVTRVEMGSRPGLKTTGVLSYFPNYMMVSFGFAIYGGEKFIFKDKEDKKK